MFGFKKVAAALAVSILAMGAAHAALVGADKPLTASSFDTKLAVPTLVYDHDFYSSTEGRLMLLVSAASLSGAGVPVGGAQPSQFYVGGNDQFRDLVLEVRINNSTGALVSGSVNIPRGNDAATGDSWTYQGALTAFGFSGSAIDAFWDVASYDFSDVAADTASLGSPATCNLGGSACGMSGKQGGLIILVNTSQIPTFGGAINFGVDWIVGLGVTASAGRAQLGAFDDGLTAPTVINASPVVDIWMTPVPEPEQYAMVAAGLLALAACRRKTNKG